MVGVDWCDGNRTLHIPRHSEAIGATTDRALGVFFRLHKVIVILVSLEKSNVLQNPLLYHVQGIP